jgi:regulator of protease activity HflC (stomatin/prohibitin superfamily)
VSSFAWLNELMTWLAKWVPRLTLVKKGDVGVLFERAGVVSQKAPGLWVWWPLVTDLRIVSTRERTMELSVQIHHQEAIGLVCRWRVVDAVKATTLIHDVGPYLDDRLQASLGLAFKPSLGNEDLADLVYRAVSAGMERFGIKIVSVDVSQRSSVFVLKCFKDWAHHEAATL